MTCQDIINKFIYYKGYLEAYMHKKTHIGDFVLYILNKVESIRKKNANIITKCVKNPTRLSWNSINAFTEGETVGS